MTDSSKPVSDFKADLVALIPFLRAFARSLCGHADEADDLAQETLTRAWKARHSFAPGTNLKAWVFTILRNQFYSERRRSWRQMAWDQDKAERIPSGSNDQEAASHLSDLARAMHGLTAEQREALILVSVGGFAYAEAASICGCAIGTVKSRVARARANLITLLDGGDKLPEARRAGGDAAARDIIAQLEQLTSPRPSGARKPAAVFP
jgi:RNA polymerase sigma-70 factor (ECF subfamily)